MVPMLRKHAVSADAIDEWEAKRTRSPRPSVALSVSSPPAVDVAEQAGWSEEWVCTRALPGPVPTHDLQLEDAPSAALVGASRAEGHGDPQAGQEPVGTTPPSPKVRGRGSQPMSGPCPAGLSTSGLGFRVVPLPS